MVLSKVFSRQGLGRKLAFVFVTFLVVAILLIGTTILYIRSSYFNQLVISEIQANALLYGLRAEIADFGFSLKAGEAQLKKLKVFNKKTNQLLLEVEQANLNASIPDLYALDLYRKAILQTLELKDVSLYINFNPDGTSNFSNLKSPPKKTETSYIKIDLSTLITTISNGNVFIKDEKNNLAVNLKKIDLNAKGTIQTSLNLSIKDGDVTYQDYKTNIQSIDVQAEIDGKGVKVAPSQFVTGYGNLRLNGVLEDWKNLNHNVDIKFSTNDAQIPSLQIKDLTEFNGQLIGNIENTKLIGELTSKEAVVPKTQLLGVNVKNIEFNYPQLELQTGQIKVQKIKSNPLSAELVQVPSVKARFLNNITFNIPNLLASNLTLPKGQLRDIKLNEIALNIESEKINTTVKKSNIADAYFDNLQAKNITLSSTVATINDDKYQVTSILSILSSRFDKLQLQGIMGNLELTNDLLNLSSSQTKLLGGQAELNLTLALSNKNKSNLQTKFSQLDSLELVKLFPVSQEVPVNGIISGSADLSWLGVDFLKATGQIKTDVQGQSSTKLENLPLNANLEVLVQEGNFEIKPLIAKLGETNLVGQATFSPKNNFFDAQYNITSKKAEELFQLTKKLNLLDQSILDLKPYVNGQLQALGKINIEKDKINVVSDIELEKLGFQNNKFQSLSARLNVTPQQVNLIVDNLLDNQQGKASFDFEQKFDDPNGGELKAKFHNFYLSFFNPSNKQPEGLFLGLVNGTLSLVKLNKEIEGSGDLELTNSSIINYFTEKIDVTFELTNQVANFSTFSVKIPAGTINGNGFFNLKTSDFQLESQTNQLEIKRLIPDNPIQGKINAKLNLSANTKSLDKLELNLDAQSDNLQASDTSLGKLLVLARSDNQGRIKAEITSYLIASQPQKAFATLSLNEKGYPLEIESELNNLDIALLLAAIDPKTVNKTSIHSSIFARLNTKGQLFNDKNEFDINTFEGTLNLHNANFNLANQILKVETPTDIFLKSGKINFNNIRVFNSGDSDFKLNGQLSLMEKGDLNISVLGKINIKDLNVLVPDTSLNGLANLDVKLTGNIDKPDLTGQLAFSNFGFSRNDVPVEFTNGTGSLILNGDRVLLRNFSMQANDGQITGQGRVELNGFEPKDFRLKLTANDVNLIYQDAFITLKGDVVLTGNQTDQLLRGNIKVLEASYLKAFDINSFNSTKITNADDGASIKGFSPRLDIKIDADSTIIVQNPQINTVASATLSLGGKLTNPNLVGRINLEGGAVNFRKQRYEIKDGVLDLPGGISLPNISLLAEGDVNNYRVFIRFTGPIDQIDLELESEPILTRTEILALITTGRPDIANGEQQDITTTGLNTGANLLAQEFISKPFGRKAEQFLGLNQFQIDPIIRANENPSARLTLGRQIIPKLSFTYSTSLTSSRDQAIILEYNLSNRFSSLVSFTQGGNSTKGDTSDGDFTFEIRGRERFALGGKGNIEKKGSLFVSSFKPLAKPMAEVVVNKPEQLKIGNDALRDVLPVKRQPFSIPLARLGEQNLTNYLQEQSYFFAKVTFHCEPINCQGERLKVVYDVIPGQRYELREIKLSGTNLLNKNVIGQLQSKEKNVFGKLPIISTLPFIGGAAYGVTSNEKLRQDSEFIRQQLIDLGYRQAKVSYQYNIDPDGQGLKINFDVTEGQINQISEIVFQGTNSISNSELQQALSLKAGEPFTPNRPREIARELQNYYAERGYLDTNIEIIIEQMSDNDIKLTYQVDEGNQATLDEVVIQGLFRTDDAPIRRFIDLKPGDLITNKKIQKLRKDLYATGNFREIQIILEPTNPSARRVLLKLTEAKPLLLVYGFGFSTDDGPRGSIELSNTNFLNKVTTSALRLRLSRREQRVQVQFTDLRPFSSLWSTTASVLYDRISKLNGTNQQISVVDQAGLTDQVNIGLTRFASSVQTERKLTEKFSFRFRYNFELAKLTNIEDAQINAFTETSRITRLAILTAGASFDSRDNPINPTKGQSFSIDYSLASRILGGNESFNKISTSYQSFKKINSSSLYFLNNSILAFSARIGLSAPFQIRSRRGDGIITDSDRRLPFSERFRSGGATTLRGFSFESAGPQAISEVGNSPARLIPLGGDALTVFNLELRYPITSRLQLVPFYDVGNVFSRVKDIDLRKMTNTIGLGLRFNTPIGPIGIDYGYLLDPQSFTTPNGGVLKQRQGVLHIKFGQSF